MAIKILIADDHRLFREGISALLKNEKDIRIVGEACNGEEAVMMASELKPDIILMDTEMPDIDGITATGIIKKSNPDIKILSLSSHDADKHVYAAMKAGAMGYIVKRVNRDDLVRIIKATFEGEVILSPFLANLLLNEFHGLENNPSQINIPHGDNVHLSNQETNILKLVIKGYDNETISKRLDIGKETVKTHLKHIFKKLQVNNRVEAAIVGKEHITE